MNPGASRPRPASSPARRHRRAGTGRPASQRGAALLVAMVLLTVVVTLSAGMVWQQWRAVQIEEAERARTQSTWILAGALDWARLILREHRTEHTSLHDAWAQPLAEARLSTFLATDRDNNADDGPEAFLSGQITDAQAKYNLRRLFANGQVAPEELKVLERLFQAGGLPTSQARALADGLVAAWMGDPSAPVAPTRVDDLAWFGLDAASIDTLRPWVVLLPSAEGTAVNLNTAPREVLAAVVEKLDLGAADRIVQVRQRSPFKRLDDVAAQAGLPSGEAGPKLVAERVGVRSAYFEVRGRLRLGDRVIEEASIVHKRSPTEVVVVQRQRLANVLPR